MNNNEENYRNKETIIILKLSLITLYMLTFPSNCELKFTKQEMESRIQMNSKLQYRRK